MQYTTGTSSATLRKRRRAVAGAGRVRRRGARARRGAARELEPRGGVAAILVAGEQQLGLLEPALADAQVGQPQHGLRAQAAGSDPE